MEIFSSSLSQRAIQSSSSTPRLLFILHRVLLSSPPIEESMSDTAAEGTCKPKQQVRAHKLNLTDRTRFPSYADLACLDLESTDYTLLEVIEDASITRPAFRVRDRDGNDFLLACYYDKPSDWPMQKSRPGHLFIVEGARQHWFMDGNQGFRLEEPSQVSFLPCTRERLTQINKKLKKQPDTCTSCNKTKCSFVCAKCKASYCSSECQKSDWTAKHRRECAVIQQLRAWNGD
ncbi:hypothetical protein P389DRAFT_61099 [Cystobasidium minutum MCA 4210]|uniref:uncharacterized protein n=1 Tax=Cystobasidium minutum MCA 4210 TaxID=1397322 RepID=UPI0034CE1EE9|eukprot:jgi/Rhomi1/61099/CE61098_111